MSEWTVQDITNREYHAGFVTDIDPETIPAGLNEEIIRLISAKKGEPEFMLQWRLKAFRHWLTMKEPTWQNVHYPPIDYQSIVYYSAPKQKKDGPKSLDEVDPKLLETYEKLGIPLREREKLAGVAVDAVFDSVSVATTFREKLAEAGVIFCSFSEAVQKHPDLVEKWLGSVVPYTDNFFATLNSAVFSDGSFCYIPKGVRCPMELSTYFRINAANTGQFERTLIVAEPGSYVSYLEGCTAPKMIHIGKNTKSTIISKGISAGHGQNTYRGLVKIGKAAEGARNYSQCDSLLMGDKCGAHTFPYIDVQNSTAQMEHEASTSKIGEDQVFYFQQRGISAEDAVNMIVNGFCKEVFKELPMEFAVEAQKLLDVRLEGSVG